MQCRESLINSDWLITKTHSALALHSRCTPLASFDIRMQQAAKTLGPMFALS